MNTDTSIPQIEKSIFERIKHINEQGQEFWSARQLNKVLGYSEYRHFIPVIDRAKQACINSGQLLENHFEDILEMVPIGSGAKHYMVSMAISRYFEVGKKVRQTIKELGATMPEDLPATESIRKIEKKDRKKLKYLA